MISLYRLLIFRVIIAALTLSMALYFQPVPNLQRQLILLIAGVFSLSIVLEFWLIRARFGLAVKLGVQFLLDLVLVSGLVFSTGGVSSPFTFLFGLVVVVAGSMARPLLIQTVGLISCICYLVTVYFHADFFAISIIVESSLKMLLQVSTLLLITGVMAALARRRQQLTLESSQVIHLHRNLQELYGKVMESLKEGILVLDASLKIQDINAAAQALLGISDSTGKPLEDIMMLSPGMMKFVFSGSCGVYHEELTDKNHTWLLTIIRLPDDDPDSTWLLKITDVSQTHALQRKLSERDKMSALGRMTALLAHEVRNPLQSIAQAVDLLPAGISAHDREIRSILVSEIQRLDRLVSDMLDYVSPLTPQPSRVHADALLRSSIRQVDIDGKLGIHIETKTDEFEVDIDHFRLVMDNLLRNAVASSPAPGTIQVQLGPYGKKQWKLTVQDRGGGVPERIRERIFEPFVSGRRGGSGLGLATVHQVCLANDWKLGEENRKGGACFHIIGHG